MSLELIQQLDVRLQEFSSRLRDDLKISAPDSNGLASALRREIQSMDETSRQALNSEPPLSTADRIGLLNTFVLWWCTESGRPGNIGQIMAMNYTCFIYLGESHFRKLRKCPAGTLARKCGEFLTDNPVRAFRNALAHGNWRGSFDNQGIDFWARKGQDPNQPMSCFHVAVNELNFWYFLAMAAAYGSLLAL
jgi:hypothetical protein